MNLRFWEWDRVYILASISLLLAAVVSVVLMFLPITQGTDDAGNQVRHTIWQELPVYGALMLLSLPILITLSPLMVLSKAGGAGRRQLMNLWLAFVMISGYVVLAINIFGVVYIGSVIFSLAAATAGTVRRGSTASGRTASGGGDASGIRVSRSGRRQKKRRRGR